MQDFIIHSLIASAVLTVLINVIPRIFPHASRKVERQVHEKLEKALEENENGNRPSVKVFFPWKTMLVVSILLTLLINLGAYFG